MELQSGFYINVEAPAGMVKASSDNFNLRSVKRLAYA